MADVTGDYTQTKSTIAPTPNSNPFGDMNCLAFAGDRFKNESLLTPPNSAVLAPWVRVSLEGAEGAEITVGNKSSNSLHDGQDAVTGTRHPHAAVTSLEYGLSNGTDVKIEIIDEMGGSFTTFFQRGLIKTLEGVSDSTLVNVQFGWMGIDCNGKAVKYPTDEDWVLHLLLMNIDVTMGEGKIKFVLNCVDMMQVSMVAPKTKKYENKTLKKAIIEFLEDDQPKMDVAFLRKPENGGAPQEWKFPAASDRPADENGNGGAEGQGHLSTYETKNETKLAVINSWLSEFLTENQKGHTITYDPLAKKPTIIIWEGKVDDEVIQGVNKDLPTDAKGTFLVNGGKCSNVLSFNPNINFIAGLFAAQNTGSDGNVTNQTATSGPSGQPKNADGTEPTTEVGQQVSTPATGPGVEAHGSDQAKVAAEAAAAQAKANACFELPQPINAELKIVGNPSKDFVDIKSIRSSYVSIIFINPFTIDRNVDSESGEDGLCGDWLCRPSINSILTNRFWMIKGITHSIRDGKYTTTLSLYLIGPGVTAPAGSNIGLDPQAPVTGGGPGGTGTQPTTGEAQPTS